MSRPQLHEHGRTAAEGAGDSGKRPNWAQYAGIVDTVHHCRQHSGRCHGSDTQGDAERAHARGGEYATDGTARTAI